jgi:hypothetical protein
VTEAELQAEILLAVGSRPDCRIWRNNTGVGRSLSGDRVIRFGLVGSADLLGILRGGRFLAVEVKTKRGRQNEAQRNFQRMIESMGGIYVLARDVQTVVDFIDDETGGI